MSMMMFDIMILAIANLIMDTIIVLFAWTWYDTQTRGYVVRQCKRELIKALTKGEIKNVIN